MARVEERRPAELVGLGLAWDELEVGYRFRTVGRTVTEADLVNFVSVTGMLEVLFTDTEYLAEGTDQITDYFLYTFPGDKRGHSSEAPSSRSRTGQ